MNLKNVSQATDEYFEQYPTFFHISDSGVIMNHPEAIRRNMAEELSLEFRSCRYGDDLEDIHFNFNDRKTKETENELERSAMAKSIKTFIQKIGKKYGSVEYSEGVEGFHFNAEITEEKGKWVYFIAAGNNGQELSTGCYLSDVALLDDENMRNHLKELDQTFHQMVLASKITEMYKV